jgi:hypothetical protein
MVSINLKYEVLIKYNGLLLTTLREREKAKVHARDAKMAMHTLNIGCAMNKSQLRAVLGARRRQLFCGIL